MPQPETRPSLILRLKGERNEQAWTEFVTAYEPFLRRLVQRQGTPEPHVPDVSQQLLIAIARSVEGWRDDGKPASFRRWLHRVARNVVIKFMQHERGQIRGQGGTDFVEVLEQVADDANSDRIREYEYELVIWAADLVHGEFREASWQAFWATQVEGRSVAEMAAELGVTPGAIYMSRCRIMARIRAKVAEVSADETTLQK
jgi:RNA polymerase sigma factor (sigma-70 family)